MLRDCGAINVFVDLPTYASESNGICCLYDLSHELAAKGFSVTGVPRNFGKYRKNIDKLPDRFKSIKIAPKLFGTKNCVFIVSETVSPRIVNSARRNGALIVWWQLAPYGLLGAKSCPEPGDLSLPFSSYVDPAADLYFYYQPRLAKEWIDALSNTSKCCAAKKSFLIYSGKGRLVKLPQFLLDACKQADVQFITRTHPATRRQLFKYMQNSHGLISFDELTNLNLEAVSIGLPVFLANPLFPAKSRNRFGVPGFIDRVFTDPQLFLNQAQLRYEGTHDTIEEGLLTRFNASTVDLISNIITGDEPDPRFLVSAQDLLDYRKYCSLLKRKRVIYTHIGGHPGGSILFKPYVDLLRKGKSCSLLMICISALDNLYCYLGIFLVHPSLFVFGFVKRFKAACVYLINLIQ